MLELQIKILDVTNKISRCIKDQQLTFKNIGIDAYGPNVVTTNSGLKISYPLKNDTTTIEIGDETSQVRLRAGQMEFEMLFTLNGQQKHVRVFQYGLNPFYQCSETDVIFALDTIEKIILPDIERIKVNNATLDEITGNFSKK